MSLHLNPLYLIRYLIGNAFVDVTVERARSMMEEKIKELEDSISKQKSLMEAASTNLNALKGQLYAKFGKNINLESD